MEKINNRKILIINQASNYLTVGFCNAFYERFEDVSLITGSVHVQGEEMNPSIKIDYINKWVERPAKKKLYSYLLALCKIFWLLKTRYRKHEIFFVSLPPMAYLLNLLVKNKFSMGIWDVYPDILKITGIQEKNVVYKIWSYLNRLSFKKTYKLFTIGDRVADLIEQYVERKKIIILPIWSIFQEVIQTKKSANPFIISNNLKGKFIVQYSGNIGLTHKVEVVVQLAEMFKNNDKILFQIIGRGPRMEILQKVVEDKKMENCKFLPFQSDEMFPYSLAAADIGIVILDSLASKGSVPSKSLNLMSYGIPSLYIAAKDSELNMYASKFGNAKCFSESELNLAKDFITQISNDKKQYEQMSKSSLIAAKYFTRSNADKFVDKYLDE